MLINENNIESIIYNIISNIKDPEFNDKTLEDLNVITEDSISVKYMHNNYYLILITWKPTTPHCKFACNIALAMRYAIRNEELLKNNKLKIDIVLEKESHMEENEINKQVNDKERYLSAFENVNIIDYLDKLII